MTPALQTDDEKQESNSQEGGGKMKMGAGVRIDLGIEDKARKPIGPKTYNKKGCGEQDAVVALLRPAPEAAHSDQKCADENKDQCENEGRKTKRIGLPPNVQDIKPKSKRKKDPTSGKK